MAFAHIAFPQVQLTDFNYSKRNSYSDPAQFIQYNNHLYFIAANDKVGRELWKSDGSADGSELVKDINIGASGSIISNFLVFKNQLFFIANDGVHGYQLWASDGTEAGTKAISGGLNYPVSRIVATSSFIFFLKKMEDNLEVWKSDGTTGGTSLVRGQIPTWNSPSNLMTAMDMVFFTAQDFGNNDTRLWRSDGSSAGTFYLTGLINGNGSHLSGTPHPTQFLEFNGALYFIARTQQFGYNSVGIMRSDGTVAGTGPVVGIHPGNTRLIQFGSALSWNGKMYFSFFEEDYNRYFIWSSQGSAETTVFEYEYLGYKYFTPSPLTVFKDRFYFTTGNDNGGTSLASFNPVSKQSNRIKEINGPLEKPVIFTSFYDANTIHASANGLFLGVKMIWSTENLWYSDGTENGTFAFPGMRSRDKMVFKEKLYFSGNLGQNAELYVSDGSLPGTRVLKDLSPSTEGIDAEETLSVIGNVALFANYDSIHGNELWRTDGSKEGTHLLKDILSGKSGSYPEGFISFRNKIFFKGAPDGRKYQLMETDGTAPGTKLTSGFPSGASLESIVPVANERLFLVASLADYSTSLLTYQGEGVITEIANFGFNTYGVGFRVDRYVVNSGIFYFIVTAAGNDVWRSDGTMEGTRKLGDFNEIQSLSMAGNKIYIVEKGPYPDPTLYLKTIDPLTGASELMKALPNQSLKPVALIPYKDRMMFNPLDASTGREFWTTDGTVQNTVLLKDIAVGAESSIEEATWVFHNDIFYFTAASTDGGLELWRTDGTSEGTQSVSDIVPGVLSSKPYSLTSCGDRLYFTAYTHDTGYEIWSTDGTASGTRLEIDVNKGEMYSNPYGYTLLNDQLLFFATTATSGVQLWSGTSVTATHPEPMMRAVSVFPNPSRDQVQIAIPQRAGALLVVYNASGQRLFSNPAVDESVVVDLQQFPSGLYYFQFSQGTWNETVKVVKH